MKEEISKATQKRLEQIALSCSVYLKDRGGLDTRNNDHDDFPEVSIWSIREMLEKAYLLGKADTTK